MAPFAGYENFDECVRRNKDKNNPKAYCGTIKNRTEDKDTDIDFTKGHVRVGNVFRSPHGEISVGEDPKTGQVFLGEAFRDEKGNIKIKPPVAKATGGTFDTKTGGFRFGRSEKREKLKGEIEQRASAAEAPKSSMTKNVEGAYDPQTGRIGYGKKRPSWMDEEDKIAEERKKTGALKPTAGIGGPLEEDVGYNDVIHQSNKMTETNIEKVQFDVWDINGRLISSHNTKNEAKKVSVQYRGSQIRRKDSQEKCAHLCVACTSPAVLKAKLCVMLQDEPNAAEIIAKILSNPELSDASCDSIAKSVEEYSPIESDWNYDLSLTKLAHDDDGSLIIAGHAQFTNDPSGDEMDNDGEVVDIASLKSCFTDYMKNPIIRFMHGKDYIKHAIGKVIDEYVAKDGTVYKTHFDKFPYLVIKISNADDASSVRKKIEEGILTGLSIGGKLLKKITDFNKRTGERFPRVFVKSWLETSVVDMPSNKGAFFQVISKCAGIEKAYPSEEELAEMKRMRTKTGGFVFSKEDKKKKEQRILQNRESLSTKQLSDGSLMIHKFTKKMSPSDPRHPEHEEWKKEKQIGEHYEKPEEKMLSDGSLMVYKFIKDYSDWNLEAAEEKGQQEAMKRQQEEDYGLSRTKGRRRLQRDATQQAQKAMTGYTSKSQSELNLQKWTHSPRPFLVYDRSGKFVSAHANIAQAESQAGQIGGHVENKATKKLTDGSSMIYKFTKG